MDTDKHGWELKNYSLPFETGVLEIQNQAYPQLRDAEIIQHLPTLMVGDPVNCLCVDDQLLLDNKIRNILAHQLAFIQHSMSSPWV